MIKTINKLPLNPSKKLIETLYRDNSNVPEVSIVMPCLNEADTLEICIHKIQQSLLENHINGEIIVADNGSTDDSLKIARRNNVRIVKAAEKGYGSALMSGIASARGKYVIMGDADDSYDFLEIPKFVEKLHEGYDLVQGCRLNSGGGRILPGAMPFLHRWLGNPIFSLLVRNWFDAPIHDVYCGMRGFTKSLYDSLDQRCTGMEFATEMIIKSSLYKVSIAEVPITLHPDGRVSHPPHLKTFRDGWRTLRFFLMYSPRWLFLSPGAILALLGMLAYILGMFGMTFENPFAAGKITFGVHTVVFGTLFILCGYQSALFAIFTKTFAVSEGLMPEDERLNRFFEIVNLERGLIISAAVMLFGLTLLAWAVFQWFIVGFGELNYADTLRLVVPGAMLVAISFQTFLSGFFVSILAMKRK